MARLVARGIPRAHPFLDGLLIFVDHNTVGHQSYLLGMRGTRGWWYYFPVAFAVDACAADADADGAGGFAADPGAAAGAPAIGGPAWFAWWSRSRCSGASVWPVI